jgi:predicted TIM-barrel fold metal-dependent hydrolase
MVTRYGLEDRIVFSTDYPHADSKYPKSVDRFLQMPFTDQTKRKFLWDNCAKLYGLEG